MRVVLVILVILLLALQFRLWQEYRNVQVLHDLVAAQQEENARLWARNEALAAEVEDLREGLEAIEERARSELGLIGEDEEFFLIIEPEDEQ